MKQKKLIFMGMLAFLILFNNVNINALEEVNTKKVESKAAAVFPTTIESIFKDSVLANEIAIKLNKQPTDTIVKNDLAAIEFLSVNFKDIHSLEGVDELYNLKNLSVTQAKISDISNVDWSRLTQLTNLNLTNNLLTDLGNANINELNNLISLSVFGNKITSISNVNFNGLARLNNLDLFNNQITDLEGVDFSGLDSIYSIILNSNKITNLDNVNWNGLSNLKVLSITENQIESLDNANWQGLNSLIQLEIANNKLTDLSNAKWPGNNTLTTINVAGNQISDLNNANLQGLSNVTSFDISSNKLTTLEGMNWNLINKINMLYLNSNEISDLNNANLNQLTSLNLLNVSNNKLNNLSKIKFDDLSKLTDIILSSNKISDVSNADWSKMPNLNTLDLMFNDIDDLKMLDFSKLQELKFLKLNFNHIYHFEGVDFSQLPNLMQVELYGQEIVLNRTEFKNQINVNNIVKDLDGSSIVPSNITNGGIYDVETNSINWNLTESLDKVVFQWDKLLTTTTGSMLGGYSGIVNVPFANAYQVTFKDWDNAIISQTRLFEGEEIVKPSNPTREGYIFNGWSKTVDLVMPANDLEYVATYTKVSSPYVLSVPAYTEIKQYTDFDLKTDVKAFDGSGKDITNDVVIDKGNFDFNKPGFYTINYSVTDADNNITKAKRLILVNDGTYVSGDKFIIQATDFTVSINNVDTSFDALYNSAQVKVYDKTTGILVKEDVVITSLGGLTKVEGIYQLTFAIANELDTSITINVVVISDMNLILEKESPKDTNNYIKETSKENVQTLPTTGSDYLTTSVQLIMLSLVIIGNRSLIKNK